MDQEERVSLSHLISQISTDTEKQGETCVGKELLNFMRPERGAVLLTKDGGEFNIFAQTRLPPTSPSIRTLPVRPV